MSTAPSLFVVGDSISIQYGPYLDAFLLDRVTYARKSGEEAALADLDLPEGANGGDSARVRAYLLARFQAEPDFRPDLLLCNCGLHDCKRSNEGGGLQVSPEDYRDNLAAIFAACAEREQAVLWVRTTPVDEALHNGSGRDFTRSNADIDACNAIADELTEAAGIPRIDLHGFTALHMDGGTSDGVHFIDAVQALQGAFIAGQVLARLAR